MMEGNKDLGGRRDRERRMSERRKGRNRNKLLWVRKKVAAEGKADMLRLCLLPNINIDTRIQDIVLFRQSVFLPTNKIEADNRHEQLVSTSCRMVLFCNQRKLNI